MLARLVERADVLMENYRVGVLDRLGFPVSRLHELNPGLVVLSITGFGHDGPEATRAGYDQIAQGEGGLMSITGTEQPTKVGVPIADLIAGMNGAFGVLAALHERARTGRGRVVRTSLLAGMVGVHAFQGTRWTVAGEVPGLAGDHHPSIAPYGMFATATRADPDRLRVRGAVARAVRRARVGPGRRRVRHQPRAGRPPRRADRPARVALRAPARRALARRCSPRPASRRARCARWTTSTRGTRRCPRGCCSSVEHPTLGAIDLPGLTAALRRQRPLRRPRPRTTPPPTLGQHNESIRAWLDSDR